MSIKNKAFKVAKAVNKVTGGTQLAKYLGEGMAKRKNPAVTRTVSGKDALKSAGKVAMSIATVAGVGGVAKVATKVPKAKATVHGVGNSFIKRTYSGHEREAMRQAAKRNAAKRKK
jgi:hypothetical protein